MMRERGEAEEVGKVEKRTERERKKNQNGDL